MKRAFTFVLFLLAVAVSAQIEGQIEINWKDSNLTFKDSLSPKTPRFQGENFYYDINKGQIYYIKSFPVAAKIDEKNFKVTNIVLEDISKQELGEIQEKGLTRQIDFSISNYTARDEKFINLKITPIIYDGVTYKKIKTLNYTLYNDLKTSTTLKRARNEVVNSVLSTGEWFNFYVERTSGVYKLTKSFLRDLGLNVNVDPRKIKIYGNGGAMLPLRNDQPYPNDLTENAVFFQGESDGVFNDEDYILFYAQGTGVGWSEENKTHINLYSDKSFYYVTVQGDNGKRITVNPSITENATQTITTFDDSQFHEVDNVNIAKLGRKWFGEDFSITNSQNFSFNFPNIDSTIQSTIEVNFGTSAPTATRFSVTSNGVEIGGDKLFPNYSDTQGNENSIVAKAILGQNTNIGIIFNNNGVPSSKGYLDYIRIEAKRNLIGYGKQFHFQYKDASKLTGIANFQITNANSITQVWDVTDIYNVTSYINNMGNVFTFKSSLGEVRKYIAVDVNDFYTPVKIGRVANQNLKGTIFKNNQGQFQDVDYLIVTPSFLNSSAERLANFHRERFGLNVKVVNLDNIYHEFSSGKQDIAAIRNFVKYVYNNASSADKKVKYLNLFGDASYDFKDRIKNNTNIVPIFHSVEDNVFSSTQTNVTDDFFVLMDDNEGRMEFANSKGLDIAVGRMTVVSIEQADQMVDKVIGYHDVKSYGKWRNNYTLIAEDLDTETLSGEYRLQEGLNKMGDEIALKRPFVNLKKIIADSYVQETSSGGERYPKVREDFVNSFDQGTLVINFFGHGGGSGLGQERLFEIGDIATLNNKNKLPLFITITCEFTRFDNPERVSPGELMFLSTKGGAIGMISTTRTINISSGQTINEALARYLYDFDNLGTTMSIGEALRLGKSKINVSALMVSYIGDPALKLALPKPKIVLTKINDQPVSETTESMKSLGVVKLSGEVRDEAGDNLLADYNGELAVNIYDKSIERKTLGNDGMKDSGNLLILNFNTLGETIFRGNASIKNGLFEFSFVVPKDIKIPVGNGRISFYAKKTGMFLDQTGVDNSVKVGGINENAIADTTSPQIKLYMNDTSFVSGGITNKNPIVLALFDDENGINTAGGIGHDIIGILDKNESNPYVLNDYYETELDNFKKGKLKFQLKNLTPGLHTFTIKAWDVYNNPVTTEIQFFVTDNIEISLTNVLNYPNPFVDYTQFWFTHNRPFEPLDVQVQILTITGKVVKTINQLIQTEGFLSREISWDGRDDFGEKIGKGVYIYKLLVKSTLDNKKVEQYEKLVIL